MHCPKCWCKHADEVTATYRICRHCGTKYRSRPSGAGKVIVHYPVMICPYCDSKKIKCTGTRDNSRYHICGDCGKTFQSTETLIKSGWF